jgi:two-component system response regulator BaeR
MKEKNILIVEDEKKLGDILHDYLSAAGFSCINVYDGAEVEAVFNANAIDVVLLDVMLPNIDGLTLCKNIRAVSKVPILMLTAKVEEIDRLLGLELGADDYICKPFSPREVVARVKAVLRRVDDTMDLTVSDAVELDENRYAIRFEQSVIELTAVEFALFKKMYDEPGRIYSRNDLMNSMYNDGRVVSERTIDSHIKKIRQKITAANHRLELLHSVYGVGYRYEKSLKDS